MKALMTAVILGCCLTGFAHAADTKPMTAQQSRMGECNKQATGKKGDERKAFMSACLSGKAAPAAAAASAVKLTPQQRMGACNKQATGKKGDERKAFMSTCLKG